MKKILLASSALVAASFAFSAQAAEPVKLSVGGYMKQYFGYADVDGTETESNTDVQSDTEVHFKGSTKLDNGITVGVRVELEGNKADSATGGQIDEQVLTLSGAFGQVLVGNEDNTGYLLHSSAPDVGIGNNDGDITNWILSPSGDTYKFVAVSGNEMVDFFADDGDADKISYISPSVMGFQVGGSYTPDKSKTGDTSLAANGKDAWIGTVAYNNKISDIDVKADFSYFGSNSGNGTSYTPADVLTAAATTTTPATYDRVTYVDKDGSQGWQAGLNVGYAGFVVGGGYMKREDDSRSKPVRATTPLNGTTVTAVEDSLSRAGTAWTAGVAYKTGPMGVSVGYGQSEADATRAAGEDKLTQWIGSGSYNMGPGVDLKASVFTIEFESEGNVPANNREGWGAVTGVAVAF